MLLNSFIGEAGLAKAKYDTPGQNRRGIDGAKVNMYWTTLDMYSARATGYSDRLSHKHGQDWLRVGGRVRASRFDKNTGLCTRIRSGLA